MVKTISFRPLLFPTTLIFHKKRDWQQHLYRTAGARTSLCSLRRLMLDVGGGKARSDLFRVSGLGEMVQGKVPNRKLPNGHLRLSIGANNTRRLKMTTMGQILDSFFATTPDVRRHVWVMCDTDAYTGIVQRWLPVGDKVWETKQHIAQHPGEWRSQHMTTAGWRPLPPGPLGSEARDPRSYHLWCDSPSGTDSSTCLRNYLLYRGTWRWVETEALHQAAIGSFGLNTTVDSIDLTGRTARMNIWMYNLMNRESLGPYTRNAQDLGCLLEPQYMWWNWHDTVSWNSSLQVLGLRPPLFPLRRCR